MAKARIARAAAAVKKTRRKGPTMIQRSRSVSPLQKAEFVTEGRVSRDFFGLTAADEAAIGDRIEQALDQAFKE